MFGRTNDTNVRHEPNGHIQKLTELHEELKTVEHDCTVFAACPVANFCRSLIDSMPEDDRDRLHARLNEILVKECEQHFDGTQNNSGTAIS